MNALTKLKLTIIFVFSSALFLINCIDKSKNNSDTTNKEGYTYFEQKDSTGNIIAIIGKSLNDSLVYIIPREGNSKMIFDRHGCYQKCTAKYPSDNSSRVNCYKQCGIDYPYPFPWPDTF